MAVTEDWLAAFEEIDAASLRVPQAQQVCAFIGRYAADIVTLIGFYREGERELIVLDMLTGAPQEPIYPIRKTERIGLLFIEEDRLPYVVILRDDFPDTEHQQIVPEGHPAVICIDNRPWAEARLTWTPAELIERTLSWFRRAARGELHDARQPLDPLLMGSLLSFIIERSVVESNDAGDLVGEHDPDFANVLRVKRCTEITGITPGMEPVTIAAYRVAPERMKRLRAAPIHLASLAALLEERGIDLLADLSARFSALLLEEDPAAWRINGRVALIVEMPLLSPRGGQQAGVDMRAFITPLSAGDIAVALGVAIRQEAQDEGSKVGYLKAVAPPSVDRAALSEIPVQSAEVHLEFERDLATRLAGRSEPDMRKAVIVGVGAIGSHIADCLVREGRFTWTIIDDDRLLPHNLARHIACSADVTKPKAEIVSAHLNAIIAGGGIAQPVPANLFSEGEAGDAVKRALSDADLIIDATASVLAARALSENEVSARRISAFFNPAGDSAVLLAEPEDRAVTLRDLEAQYLGLILRTPALAAHLGKLAETIAYTGACRAITNRIPQWRASVLAGLAAGGIGVAVDGPNSAITIWTMTEDGAVTLDSAKPEPVTTYAAHDWTIAIDAGLIQRINAMRDERLPSETGGILFGLVDIPAKRIHLVHATPPPKGSVEERAGFVRGMAGVDDLMEDVRRKTAGQLRYVGEWHSHPPRRAAWPSEVDAVQLDWLAALMGMDSMPALMVIAADNEVSVIFADQRADPVSSEEAA